MTLSNEIDDGPYATYLGSFYSHGRGLFIAGTLGDQTHAFITKASLDESSYTLDAMVRLTLSGPSSDVALMTAMISVTSTTLTNTDKVAAIYNI